MSLLPPPRRRARPDFSLAIINIVFLLLLFYLATGSLITPREEAVDAPQTERLPLEKLPRPLLTLGEDGSLTLEGKPVAPADLAAAVRRATEGGHVLNVLAARGLPARDLLPILAELDAAGAAVRLVTLRAGAEDGHER